MASPGLDWAAGAIVGGDAAQNASPDIAAIEIWDGFLPCFWSKSSARIVSGVLQPADRAVKCGW